MAVRRMRRQRAINIFTSPNYGNNMKENSKAFWAGQHLIGCTLTGLLIWLAGAVLELWLKSSFAAVALAVVGMWILFSAFTLYFFRDPDPRVPNAPEAVVAPAHGLVDGVDETTETEFLGGPCRRISIFLSVLDVHVQNAPVAGKIIFFKHRPGRYLNALKTESAECNESVLIGIESHEQPGERMAVRQIAGVIARRIVSWVGVGDTVVRGQRLGLIQFGSRCDLYLPLTAQIRVRPGDRVVAGETVVAVRGRIRPAPAEPGTLS
jgi:phosphatidylserine decarboxylase